MKNTKQISFFLLFLPYYFYAQIGQPLITGGRMDAMGKANTALHNSEEALWHNPANLQGIKQTNALVSSEWRFGVKDFCPIGIGFIVPNSSGVLGFSFQHFGFSGVSDNMLSVNYAKTFSSKFDAGVRFSYQHLRFREFGSRNFLAYDIGFNTLIIKNLRMGFHAQNPIPYKINEQETTPSVFRLGFAYTVNENVFTCFEIKKDLIFPAAFRFGLEYKTSEKLFLRGGFESYPTQFGFGFGYILLENLNLDISVSQQSILGVTPALTIRYLGKNK